jgi:AraC-like DNA-binding protein
MLPLEPLQLPMPRDERARSAASQMQDDPARPLTTVARQAGASRRTLERLFLHDTAMPLGRWRRRARLISALRLLAEGVPVTRVASEVGYDTTSAFIAAFRRELGTTPGRYFAD